MLALVGILSVLSGTILASTSGRFPGHVRAIEIGAGLLLISGFALASCALPIIL
jgi:hypothetical protein